ncbi:rRNA adenine N-6-methyltransferase family protein [Cetobacterium sp.]|uniref:rRNA adenine N-6-methyltransferase family protein n=1 Tax=Cetobacterium sp. TaxID=2071632 RepID=UPI003F36ACCC
MVSKIDYLNSDVIVELSAGTGVFTEKLIKHLKPNTKLFIFEINESLYKNLCDKGSHQENAE